MSNSTPHYWSVNGRSLQTYAFNVETLGGKFQTPPLRGSDRQFAYRHGRVHRRRWFDSQTVQLGMWVIGADENGDVPRDREDLFRKNLKLLQELFVDPLGGEFDLTKRWRDGDTQEPMEATGRGIVPDGLAPAMEGGPYRAKLVADVFMADPFFYGPEVTVEIPLNTDVVIDLPGDVSSSQILLELHGALSNPILTNLTPAPEISLKVGSSIAAADKVTVDVEQTTVIRANDGANIIGTLTHSGSRPWFELRKGVNTVRLSSDSGAGSATLRYKSVWY